MRKRLLRRPQDRRATAPRLQAQCLRWCGGLGCGDEAQRVMDATVRLVHHRRAELYAVIRAFQPRTRPIEAFGTMFDEKPGRAVEALRCEARQRLKRLTFEEPVVVPAEVQALEGCAEGRGGDGVVAAAQCNPAAVLQGPRVDDRS